MSHGGKRKGAGRPPRESPLKAITIRIEQKEAERFRLICQKLKRSQAAQVTRWIQKEQI